MLFRHRQCSYSKEFGLLRLRIPASSWVYRSMLPCNSACNSGWRWGAWHEGHVKFGVLKTSIDSIAGMANALACHSSAVLHGFLEAEVTGE